MCIRDRLIPDDEKERFKFLEEFVKKIENTKELYEDDKIRIFPKSQSELWDEGYDEEKKEYVGSKWGKYIRAPEIFFKIFRRNRKIITKLSDVAEVIAGIITGCNEFFYLSEDEIKEWKIEKEFLIPVLKTPKELNKIVFTSGDLKYKLFYVKSDVSKLKGTNALRYIKFGESQSIDKLPTLQSREKWYQIPMLKTAQLVWVDLKWMKHICHLNVDNVPFEHNYYGINAKNTNNNLLLCAYLNSTLSWLFIEIFGRINLGEGAVRLVGEDLKDFPVIHVDKIREIFKERKFKVIKNKIRKIFKVIGNRKIGTVFEELGANSPEEVSLDKVKPDRRELDKIIMGEILGLTEEEQLEVYKAVIQLVKERIERAKSVEKEKQKRKKISEESYAEKIISEVNVSKLKKFPDDYLPTQIEIEKTIQLPEEKENVEIGRDLLGYYVKVGEEKIKCSSVVEAKWIYYSAISGKNEVKIPKDVSVLDKIVKNFDQVYNSISKEINEKLEKYIPEIKFRKNVKAIIERKLGIKL